MSAYIAQNNTNTRLAVTALEIGQPLEVVDLASSVDRRDANSTNSEPANRKRVGLAFVMQFSAAYIAAEDKGDLDLFDLNRSRLLRFFGLREGRTVLEGYYGCDGHGESQSLAAGFQI